MKVTKDFYNEIEIDLTGTCNLSCLLCSRNYIHAQHMVYKNIRPLNEIINQLDSFPNLTRIFLAGQVSEPTLYPDFLDFLKYLKSRNIYIELFSNGDTRDEIFWKEVGNILHSTDQMHFTICGSTNDMHIKYRVGSNLNRILDNVKAFRMSDKDNDFCQIIRFEYNKDDIKNIFNFDFSHFYIVDSEGNRLYNDKIKKEHSLIRPLVARDSIIKKLYDSRPPIHSNIEIMCKSIKSKKLYIDQKGNESACYVHFEYTPTDIMMNNYDYTKILEFNYPECWACSKRCSLFINKLGLDFIC